jgi:hypothetical protein
MDIAGLWKIKEINAFGMDFKQTWKETEGLDSDEGVPEMQKIMAKTMYQFEQGGRYVTILPKEAAEDGGSGEYDKNHVIGSVGSWKEEGGRIFVSTEENGELVWNEAVPWGDGLELLGFFRIEKI